MIINIHSRNSFIKVIFMCAIIHLLSGSVANSELVDLDSISDNQLNWMKYKNKKDALYLSGMWPAIFLGMHAYANQNNASGEIREFEKKVGNICMNIFAIYGIYKITNLNVISSQIIVIKRNEEVFQVDYPTIKEWKKEKLSNIVTYSFISITISGLHQLSFGENSFNKNDPVRVIYESAIIGFGYYGILNLAEYLFPSLPPQNYNSKKAKNGNIDVSLALNMNYSGLSVNYRY